MTNLGYFDVRQAFGALHRYRENMFNLLKHSP